MINITLNESSTILTCNHYFISHKVKLYTVNKSYTHYAQSSKMFNFLPYLFQFSQNVERIECVLTACFLHAYSVLAACLMPACLLPAWCVFDTCLICVWYVLDACLMCAWSVLDVYLLAFNLCLMCLMHFCCLVSASTNQRAALT